MKRILTSLIVAFMLVFSAQQLSAQSAGMSPQRLPLIEHEMFDNGNMNFIVVDLLIDNLMQPGDNCQFLYKKGKITFQGKKLPANMEQKYQSRMNEFFAKKGITSEGMYAVNVENVTMNKVLDPASSFRKATQNTTQGKEGGTILTTPKF